VTLSAERRQALLEVKLATLVRERWGTDVGAAGALSPGAPSPGAFPGGAALGGTGGNAAWVLVGEASARSLGGALAWALKRGASELHLLVDAGTATDGAVREGGVRESGDVAGVLARRATAFAMAITVWRVVGRELLAADPVAISPPPPLPPGVAAWADVLRAHGADPVVEHGVLTGEVLGLEVARVIVDAAGPHLEVGVGSQDRRAQLLLRPDRSPTEALAKAVVAVREWRSPGARPHPAATLAAERWLRAAVVAHPEMVGASYLAPVPPPLPRGDLRQPSPAPAAGSDRHDGPLLVVCSTGIDLDLVPSAADSAMLDGRPGLRVILAVPPGDDHAATHRLAAALRRPAEVVVVAAGWRAFAPVA
jgi:hypothetical protein